MFYNLINSKTENKSVHLWQKSYSDYIQKIKKSLHLWQKSEIPLIQKIALILES